jgi:hypothetical protein
VIPRTRHSPGADDLGSAGIDLPGRAIPIRGGSHDNRTVTPSVVPLPSKGDVFLDARGADRGMRVSWHHEQGLVVVSLWRADTCVGTLRLPREDVPRLISALAEGLAEGGGAAYPTVGTTSPPQAC